MRVSPTTPSFAAAYATADGCPNPDPELVFTACARFGVAVEVNSRPERKDPPKRLLRLAVEAGCRVAIDTDAHAPGQLDWLPIGCERAAACGVEPAMVINTLDADQLRALTAAKG